jgi:hypothetical protein
VAIDDLISVEHYRPHSSRRRLPAGGGLRFKTYAERRITGLMLDYLRGENLLPRGQRKRVREAEGETGPITVSLDQVPLQALPRKVRVHSNLSDRIDPQAACKGLSPARGLRDHDAFDLDRPAAEVARALGLNRAAFRRSSAGRSQNYVLSWGAA